MILSLKSEIHEYLKKDEPTQALLTAPRQEEKTRGKHPPRAEVRPGLVSGEFAAASSVLGRPSFPGNRMPVGGEHLLSARAHGMLSQP